MGPKTVIIKKGDLYEGKSNLTLKDLSANSNNLGDATLKIDASKDLKSFVMDFDILNNPIYWPWISAYDLGFLPISIILLSPFSGITANRTLLPPVANPIESRQSNATSHNN